MPHRLAPQCTACGTAAVPCFVDVDRDALDLALALADAQRARALRPWQCGGCGGSDPDLFRSMPAVEWLAATRHALAIHDATRARAHAARERFRARNVRLARDAEEQARARAANAAANASRVAVDAALARARAARGAPPRNGA
ncbi:hypothetical protein [Chiayiivirga flava]|uniref:Na+-translocating ferredoxin:NAD+ oxidoreductase RnfC subunit n=1 Tax=Chiayiivirga flava TaxID=659595 RepID=A0A7W8G0P9_9GAMM|nr:hypothetical protein [Chiayiivirga flava]MBB5209406.1 Na+-translocating ferredoxin:NAD+ oxidoreductase RnfC subunit [Chiayiivirga flava]